MAMTLSQIMMYTNNNSANSRLVNCQGAPSGGFSGRNQRRIQGKLYGNFCSDAGKKHAHSIGQTDWKRS